MKPIHRRGRGKAENADWKINEMKAFSTRFPRGTDAIPNAQLRLADDEHVMTEWSIALNCENY